MYVFMYRNRIIDMYYDSAVDYNQKKQFIPCSTYIFCMTHMMGDLPARLFFSSNFFFGVYYFNQSLQFRYSRTTVYIVVTFWSIQGYGRVTMSWKWDAASIMKYIATVLPTT